MGADIFLRTLRNGDIKASGFLGWYYIRGKVKFGAYLPRKREASAGVCATEDGNNVTFLARAMNIIFINYFMEQRHLTFLYILPKNRTTKRDTRRCCGSEGTSQQRINGASARRTWFRNDLSGTDCCTYTERGLIFVGGSQPNVMEKFAVARSINNNGRQISVGRKKGSSFYSGFPWTKTGGQFSR